VVTHAVLLCTLVEIVGAQHEFLGCTMIHEAKLSRVCVTHTHALAHRAPLIADRLHCLRARDGKVAFTIMHQAHDVVRKTRVTIPIHLVVNQLGLINILPKYRDVFIYIRSCLLVCHTQRMQNFMCCNAHEIASIWHEVQLLIRDRHIANIRPTSFGGTRDKDTTIFTSLVPYSRNLFESDTRD